MFFNLSKVIFCDEEVPSHESHKKRAHLSATYNWQALFISSRPATVQWCSLPSIFRYISLKLTGKHRLLSTGAAAQWCSLPTIFRCSSLLVIGRHCLYPDDQQLFSGAHHGRLFLGSAVGWCLASGKDHPADQ